MSGSRPLSLLIVEDDPHLRTLLTAAAERSGRFGSVQTAADGQEAIDRLTHGASAASPSLPDFILTDLSMPRMDGVQLIHALKRLPRLRDIPIAVMTSSNRPNDREDATAAGCCAFFNKPARLEEMATLVGSLPRICGVGASVHAPPGL